MASGTDRLINELQGSQIIDALEDMALSDFGITEIGADKCVTSIYTNNYTGVVEYTYNGERCSRNLITSTNNIIACDPNTEILYYPSSLWARASSTAKVDTTFDTSQSADDYLTTTAKNLTGIRGFSIPVRNLSTSGGFYIYVANGAYTLQNAWGNYIGSAVALIKEA